jgi:hypothetical protein
LSKRELLNFFYDEIIQINFEQGKLVSDNCIYYIVNLLNSNTENLSLQNKIYLFDLYQKVIEATTNREKIEIYKFIGDYTLFINGCFAESIPDSGTSKYYASFGINAYNSAADLGGKDILYEVSENYLYCVSLLNEFSSRNIINNIDIIKLYNIWLLSNNTFLKKRLGSLGLLIGEVEE